MAFRLGLRRIALTSGRRTGVVSRRWLSESVEKKLSPEVEKICDDIIKLNLLQVSELVEALNEKLNLPAMPAGGMMPMMAPMAGSAPAAAPAAEEEAPPEAKPIVGIQLDSFDAAGKIKLIKEVKNLTGLGLKESKAAVEGAPGILMNDVKREEAEKIAKQLEELGAKVSLV